MVGRVECQLSANKKWILGAVLDETTGLRESIAVACVEVVNRDRRAEHGPLFCFQEREREREREDYMQKSSIGTGEPKMGRADVSKRERKIVLK